MRAAFIIILLSFVLLGCSSNVSVPSSKKDVFADYETALIKEKAGYLAGDHASVRPLFAEKANEGNPVAQYVYGYMLFYGQGGEADIVKAEKWIRKAAEKGYQRALRALALISTQRTKMENSGKAAAGTE